MEESVTTFRGVINSIQRYGGTKKANPLSENEQPYKMSKK